MNAVTTKAKAWVAVIGGILTVVVPYVVAAAAELPPEWEALVTAIIAVLTAYGVYQVPNKPTETPPPPSDLQNPWRP